MAVKSKASATSMDRLVPVLVFVSIILAFGVGVLWQKVDSLDGGSTKTVARPTTAPSAANQPSAPANGKLTEDQASKIPAVSAEDHVRGASNPKVYLIEYSDYECPFCSRFHPTAQQVLDEYGDDVAWVYRHFPLDQIHPKARPAAEAAECIADIAGEDAFWAFTDTLFEDQTKLSDLESVYAEIGVSASAVTDCVENGTFSGVVEDQYQGGISAGITGTPGNIILNSDGEAWLVPGALPFEQISTTIEEAL